MMRLRDDGLPREDGWAFPADAPAFRQNGHRFRHGTGHPAVPPSPRPEPVGEAVSVRVVDARRVDIGARLLTHPLGSLFASPTWIDVLERSYGLQISASLVLHHDSADMLLFSYISDLRGDRVVSLPFSDYCDPLVDDDRTWPALVGPLLSLDVPVKLRCLRRLAPVADHTFEAAVHGLWHGVDLGRPEDELWSGLAASARQNIRRAIRSGVVVREARGIEDVRTFHAMHSHVRKFKYRLLAQPAGFFERIHEAFAPNDDVFVLFACVDGRPIAGILFILWKDALYYKFNAAFDQELRPNDLLMWEGIKWGCRRKLRQLDLGYSDVSQPGLIRYKRKYATSEQPITTLQWQPPGYVDRRADEAHSTLCRMTHLLTEPSVPDEITRAAGEVLYRFFS